MSTNNISRPEVKNTIAHRLATDTAIEWRTKNPVLAPPPLNIPAFPGQLVAVEVNIGQCKLYVGAEDQSRWFEVV